MLPGRPTVWLRYRACAAAQPAYRVEWEEIDSLRCRLFHSYRNALKFARKTGNVINDVPTMHRSRD
jgi:hypothetical protein